MWRSAGAALLMLLMGGCQSQVITPSFEYAATSLGVYNSGLLTVGQLFVWDTNGGTLTRLDEVPFPDRPTTLTGPTSLMATQVSSLRFGGGISAVVQANAAAAIENNVAIRVENGTREEYRNTIGLIAQEIVRRKSAGEDVGTAWLLDRAVGPGSGLRYVIVSGLVRSDRAELALSNVRSGELKLQIADGRGGNAVIDLSRSSLSSCVGAGSPCFVSFVVLDPFINERGNYDFRPVTGVPGRQIGDLLKTL